VEGEIEGSSGMRSEREYRFLDMDRVNARVREKRPSKDEPLKDEPLKDEPADVLYETLLDLLQLAEAEGLAEPEVDSALRRVFDYRAERVRRRIRLHPTQGG
jgi:hypothetical protein